MTRYFIFYACRRFDKSKEKWRLFHCEMKSFNEWLTETEEKLSRAQIEAGDVGHVKTKQFLQVGFDQLISSCLTVIRCLMVWKLLSFTVHFRWISSVECPIAILVRYFCYLYKPRIFTRFFKNIFRIIIMILKS